MCSLLHPRHKKEEKAELIDVGPIVLPMTAAVSAPPLASIVASFIIGISSEHSASVVELKIDAPSAIGLSPESSAPIVEPISHAPSGSH